jgi:hypothetical protein
LKGRMSGASLDNQTIGAEGREERERGERERERERKRKRKRKRGMGKGPAHGRGEGGEVLSGMIHMQEQCLESMPHFHLSLSLSRNFKGNLPKPVAGGVPTPCSRFSLHPSGM